MSRRLFLSTGLVGGVLAGVRAVVGKTAPPAQVNELEGIRRELNAIKNSMRNDAPPNVPIGTILSYAGVVGGRHNLPNNWRLCDGSSLSRMEYSILFDKIDVYWGIPERPDEFRLPDLRGMFLRGVNQNRSDRFKDPDVGRREPHKTGDEHKNQVGSFQHDELKKHSHRYECFRKESNSSEPHIRVPDDPLSWDISTCETGEAGTSEETRPQNAYVNWIIRVK